MYFNELVIVNDFGYNMKNLKIVIIKCFLLAFFCFRTELLAGFGGTTLEFFKKNNKRNYLLNDNYLNSFYLGTYNSDPILRINAGYDIAIATITRSSGYVYSMGIPTKVNLSFIKNENKYELDNFYWDLGAWIQIDFNKELTFRLSPVYHRSAYILNSIDSGSKNNINNVMIYLELLISPKKLKGFEIKGAGGYFYKKEARQYLRGVVDLDFFYEIPLDFLIKPVIILKNEIIYERGIRYGVSGSFGIEIKNSSIRGIAILMNLYDKPHSGVYYNSSEKGIGGNLKFIF